MSQQAQARTMDALPDEVPVACDDGGYFERRLGLPLARLRHRGPPALACAF